MTWAIEFNSLRMDYADGGGGLLTALEGIHLRAREGEFVSFVGPSGCGKTTLLKITSGLLRPTGGEVRINGSPVWGPTQDVGFVFQSAVLLRWRTVIRNILLQVEVRGLDQAESLARARRLLRMVGLEGFEDKYPYQLSGGMQQRAAICRALIHDPPLLLMDEPFGSLDAFTREQMHLELQNIWMNNGKTVLFVTHSIPEAIFLSDRVVVLSARPGRLRDVIEVDLPRPRRLGIEEDLRFGKLVNRIRGLLKDSQEEVWRPGGKDPAPGALDGARARPGHETMENAENRGKPAASGPSGARE
jgi:NitT/TauT family transport system ATP-binding protein